MNLLDELAACHERVNALTNLRNITRILAGRELTPR
jgi:hypothetical protein